MTLKKTSNHRIDQLLHKLNWKRKNVQGQELDGTTKIEDNNNKIIMIKEAEEEEEKQLPANMMQNPTSMALLFLLALEAVLVTVMESFVIYYHSMIFAQCQLNLVSLGLSQADLIYHGLFIVAPIYQLFLYMDTLKQRNIFQLFTLLLFGKFVVDLATLHLAKKAVDFNVHY